MRGPLRGREGQSWGTWRGAEQLKGQEAAELPCPHLTPRLSLPRTGRKGWATPPRIPTLLGQVPPWAPAPEGSRPRGSWGDGVGKPGVPSAPQPTPQREGEARLPLGCVGPQEELCFTVGLSLAPLPRLSFPRFLTLSPRVPWSLQDSCCCCPSLLLASFPWPSFRPICCIHLEASEQRG